MSGLSVLDWAARILIGALVAGGIGASAFFFVRMSGDDDPQVVAQLIETPTPLAPTDTPAPPTPTPTALPPTATEPVPTEPLPTVAAPTPLPTLPPPPPRPDQLTPVEDAILAGGQWYEYDSCTAFYLPAGRTFIIHMALNDPGGFFTLALEDEATGSTIAFSYDDGGERNRTVNTPEAGPLLDQIADTFSKEC